jgi:serine/threonine protein phosphatase PrpC
MVTELTFGADEIALLYTDGLVERRDEDIDTCLNRLAAAAHVMASARLADGLAALVKQVGADEPGRDDVTAIAVRRSG